MYCCSFAKEPTVQLLAPSLPKRHKAKQNLAPSRNLLSHNFHFLQMWQGQRSRNRESSRENTTLQGLLHTCWLQMKKDPWQKVPQHLTGPLLTTQAAYLKQKKKEEERKEEKKKRICGATAISPLQKSIRTCSPQWHPPAASLCMVPHWVLHVHSWLQLSLSIFSSCEYTALHMQQNWLRFLLPWAFRTTLMQCCCAAITWKYFETQEERKPGRISGSAPNLATYIATAEGTNGSLSWWDPHSTPWFNIPESPDIWYASSHPNPNPHHSKWWISRVAVFPSPYRESMMLLICCIVNMRGTALAWTGLPPPGVYCDTTTCRSMHLKQQMLNITKIQQPHCKCDRHCRVMHKNCVVIPGAT